MKRARSPDEQDSSRAVDICGDVLVEFEGEAEGLRVSSHVLCLASPVFLAMLTSGMCEEKTKRVEVAASIGNREQFEQFYGFLLPAKALGQRLGRDNVDGVLAFSDYYQVSELKEACEEFLLRVSASLDRLLQAERHGIPRQRQRCLEHISASPTVDLSKLEAHPKLLLEVARVSQQRLLECRQGFKHKVEQLAPGRAQLSAKEVIEAFEEHFPLEHPNVARREAALREIAKLIQGLPP
uniref:BTB domain-containing protein n=1 Tax=Alexandrium monilatum TaxID=311494 RepID=A0A7S4QIH9_9DINO